MLVEFFKARQSAGGPSGTRADLTVYSEASAEPPVGRRSTLSSRPPFEAQDFRVGLVEVGQIVFPTVGEPRVPRERRPAERRFAPRREDIRTGAAPRPVQPQLLG